MAAHLEAKSPAQPERAGFSTPVLGSPQSVCVVCGGPRDPRRREACSDKCRAALSRHRRTQTQTTRDQETRDALEAIARLVQVTLGRLEKGGLPCDSSRGGGDTAGQ
jgi:predicted nucleic acid-binding Zn ribbon protein